MYNITYVHMLLMNIITLYHNRMNVLTIWADNEGEMKREREEKDDQLQMTRLSLAEKETELLHCQDKLLWDNYTHSLTHWHSLTHSLIHSFSNSLTTHSSSSLSLSLSLSISLSLSQWVSTVSCSDIDGSNTPLCTGWGCVWWVWLHTKALSVYDAATSEHRYHTTRPGEGGRTVRDEHTHVYSCRLIPRLTT